MNSRDYGIIGIDISNINDIKIAFSVITGTCEVNNYSIKTFFFNSSTIIILLKEIAIKTLLLESNFSVFLFNRIKL